MNSPLSQILIRAPRHLHQQLMTRAKDQDQSLNEYCIERLRIPSSLDNQEILLRDILQQADRLLRSKLLGLVLYGSQARGDAHSDSDWDFLVVIDGSIPLERQLYRWWEEQTGEQFSSRVEINFVHRPDSLSVATAFWSEIALDGVILYEQNFTVSQHLNRVRRSIAEGRIVRKTSHGQSYWVYREVA